jgi:hypothetical protein
MIFRGNNTKVRIEYVSLEINIDSLEERPLLSDETCLRVRGFTRSQERA